MTNGSAPNGIIRHKDSNQTSDLQLPQNTADGAATPGASSESEGCKFLPKIWNSGSDRHFVNSEEACSRSR